MPFAHCKQPYQMDSFPTGLRITLNFKVQTPRKLCEIKSDILNAHLIDFLETLLIPSNDSRNP